MLTTPPSRWAVQGLTFAVWALAAASAVYWGLKLAARSSAAPAAPIAARSPAVPDPASIARLLGGIPVQAAAAAMPSLASRFSLVGVVARASHSGVALISVDGKPAKPFRVGATVDSGLVLQSVEARRASLGTGVGQPAAVTLELPAVSGSSVRLPPGAQAAPPPPPQAAPMPPGMNQRFGTPRAAPR